MRLDGDSGRDKAYRHLRTITLTDPAMSGTFVNEQQVATTIGVSRTPVREALLMLAAEDLVQLVPHRGAFLAPVTGRQVAELMQSRELIECWAAGACIDADDRTPVSRMTEVLALQRKLVQAEPREFIEADRDFHVALVHAAGNGILENLYESLHARQVLLGVVALSHSSRRREDVLSEHQAIVDALGRGDREACEAAIRAHLDTTRELLTHG